MPDENKPDGSLDEAMQPVDGGDDVAAAEADMVDDKADVSGEDIAGDEAVGELQDQPEFEKIANEGDASEDDAEAAMLKMLEEEGNGVDAVNGTPGDEFPDLSGVRMEQPEANPVEFQQLSPSGRHVDSKHNIEMLLDVKMPVSIELGRTDMAISDLLTLGPGSVVELNKLAGEPVDLLVNNVVIAKGEVVVVDENFGVRVTLLMSPEERLKSLAQQ